MLKKVRIQGYKSLQNLEVDLKPLSVLFGPNAAGKSNFLDALQLLSRIATNRTLSEAFAPPYRGKPLESFTFGAGGLRGLLDKPSETFMIEVDVELSPRVVETVNQQISEMRRPTKNDETNGRADNTGARTIHERNLRYRIEIEILPRSGILRVADEYLAALNARGEPKGTRSPFLEKMGDRLSLRMEGQAHPTYHETNLDHSILSLPLYPPHYPHMVAMRQELASWFFFYFEPRERMRVPNPVKEVRHIGLMGEELAGFLNTLKVLDEPQFRAVEKSIRMIIPTVTGIDVGVNDLGEVEFRLLEGNIPIPARVLSEGTLRILGLLALGGVKDAPTLIGFEEPENGIQPRRIRAIAEFLKTRTWNDDTQLIVTTHSPTLLDELPPDSLYACRKTATGTEIESSLPLWQSQDIDAALNHEEQPLSISERILRGDFDA
ncbi:MAG: DNA recombination protein RecF [Chloroflexota bacterium]|nr:DUF2813 domain-containing protein [Chloroflexota bacterium]NOG63548.1 AAA family ATPase [Chloroflexota bacterium]GIK62741.1 MAG: DNA recombination protein RecF [Chloroflexota bacterium]